MHWYCVTYLLALSLAHSSLVEGQYYDTGKPDTTGHESGKSETTVMMNIDGEYVPVVLPVKEVPPDIPRTIHTRPRDERIDDTMVILPNGLRADSPVPSPAGDTSQPQAPATSSAATPPSVVPTPPAGSSPSVPNAPLVTPSQPPPSNSTTQSPSPTNISTSPSPSLPPPPPVTTTNPPAPAPPTTLSPAPTSPLPPATSPQPPATTTPKPAQGTVILASAWLPMFGVPFFTSEFFGPIYPVYTHRPPVFQYVASPTIYYMQVIHIVYQLVPPNTLPLSSIMDLSLAVTNILRSNAESLGSVVVEEPDGPNLVPELQSDGETGFRSSSGNALTLPTPKDVTSEIENAVQTYADPVPEDVQEKLTEVLSKNMAELLKPLYQNIAYTRKLRFEDSDGQDQNDHQGYSYSNLYRRSPAEESNVVVVSPPANGQSVPAPAIIPISPGTNPVAPGSAVPVAPAANPIAPGTVVPVQPSAAKSVAPANPVPVAPVNPVPVAPASNPIQPMTNAATDAMHNAANAPVPQMPAIHANANTDALTAHATPPPAVQPIVINNNMDTSKLQHAGSDLIDSLLAAPTSVFNTFPTLLSLLNPFKIAYGIMNTIATTYPKIQLSVLVGLSTAITQIVAKVLELIASFCGIFAAIGRKRRDISSDIMPPPINMDQVLGDLHKDIKEAVNAYVPEAPPKIKKELTEGLYQNSLDTISEALVPMEQEIKKKTENSDTLLAPPVQSQPETLPLTESYSPNDGPPLASNPGNLRSKTDIFGFDVPAVGGGGLNVDANPDPFGNPLGGAQADVYGNSDVQKQVNQFSSDLQQLPQDFLGLLNFGAPPQQNGGQQKLKNQNDFFSWNK